MDQSKQQLADHEGLMLDRLGRPAGDSSIRSGMAVSKEKPIKPDDPLDLDAQLDALMADIEKEEPGLIAMATGQAQEPEEQAPDPGLESTPSADDADKPPAEQAPPPPIDDQATEAAPVSSSVSVVDEPLPVEITAEAPRPTSDGSDTVQPDVEVPPQQGTEEGVVGLAGEVDKVPGDHSAAPDAMVMPTDQAHGSQAEAVEGETQDESPVTPETDAKIVTEDDEAGRQLDKILEELGGDVGAAGDAPAPEIQQSGHPAPVAGQKTHDAVGGSPQEDLEEAFESVLNQDDPQDHTSSAEMSTAAPTESATGPADADVKFSNDDIANQFDALLEATPPEPGRTAEVVDQDTTVPEASGESEKVSNEDLASQLDELFGEPGGGASSTTAEASAAPATPAPESVSEATAAPAGSGASEKVSNEDLASQLDELFGEPGGGTSSTTTEASAAPATPAPESVSEATAAPAGSGESEKVSNEDLASQLDALFGEPGGSTSSTTAEASAAPGTPAPESVSEASAAPAGSGESEKVSNEDLASQLDELFGEPGGGASSTTAEASAAPATPAPESVSEATAAPAGSGASEKVSNEDLASQLDELFGEPGGGTSSTTTEASAAPATPAPESVSEATAAPAGSGESEKVSNEDLASQLDALFGEPGGSTSSTTAEASAAPGTPAPESVSEASAAPAGSGESEKVSNEDLASQLDELFGEPGDSGADVVPQVEASSETPPPPASESLDQIDQLLAQQADHTVSQDFDTSDVVIDPPVPAPSSQDGAMASVRYGDDTSLAGASADLSAVSLEETSLSGELDTTLAEPGQEVPGLESLGDGAPAAGAPEESESAVEGSKKRRLGVETLLHACDVGARRCCAVINRPIERLSPVTRQTIGYIAIYHLFIGSVLVIRKLLAWI